MSASAIAYQDRERLREQMAHLKTIDSILAKELQTLNYILSDVLSREIERNE